MKYIVPVFALLLLVSCAKKTSHENAAVNKTETAKVGFTLPVIPSVITTDAQKYEFLAENYWTNFNFKDTTQIHQNPIAEQLYADFLNLLSQVPPSTAQIGMGKMMNLAQSDSTMYSFFASLGEKYLYDPNSAQRNEALYCAVLENILASKFIDDAHKVRPRSRYELAQKNKVGDRAINFKYTLASGKQSSLYSIKSMFTLVYFNNPGCGDCKHVKQQLNSSSLLSVMIQGGSLKLLSIYPDEDLAEWHKDRSTVPASWINAYDKGTVVKNGNLYDLKAIPTLYLLDSNKRVLLKDARFEEIERYLAAKNEQ